MKKRIASLFLAIAMIASLGISAMAAERKLVNPTGVAKSYTDVPSTYQFYNEIAHVTAAGLFQGTTDTTFSPWNYMSRGQFVMVLARLDGVAGTGGIAQEGRVTETNFSDVDSTYRFAAAIAWATSNNIVQGYSDRTFRPRDPISRAQIAALLHRYVNHKNYTLVAVTNPAAQFSDYSANTTISTACPEVFRADLDYGRTYGLIRGYSDGTYRPNIPVGRAQVAAMLDRIVLYYSSGSTGGGGGSRPSVVYRALTLNINSDGNPGNTVTLALSATGNGGVPSTAQSDSGRWTMIPSGTTVTATITAAPGYSCAVTLNGAAQTVAADGTVPTFVMDADKTLNVTFTQGTTPAANTRVLNLYLDAEAVNDADDDMGTVALALSDGTAVQPGDSVEVGDTIVVTATPKDGYKAASVLFNGTALALTFDENGVATTSFVVPEGTDPLSLVVKFQEVGKNNITLTTSGSGVFAAKLNSAYFTAPNDNNVTEADVPATWVVTENTTSGSLRVELDDTIIESYTVVDSQGNDLTSSATRTNSGTKIATDGVNDPYSIATINFPVPTDVTVTLVLKELKFTYTLAAGVKIGDTVNMYDTTQSLTVKNIPADTAVYDALLKLNDNYADMGDPSNPETLVQNADKVQFILNSLEGAIMDVAAENTPLEVQNRDLIVSAINQEIHDQVEAKVNEYTQSVSPAASTGAVKEAIQKAIAEYAENLPAGVTADMIEPKGGDNVRPVITDAQKQELTDAIMDVVKVVNADDSDLSMEFVLTSDPERIAENQYPDTESITIGAGIIPITGAKVVSKDPNFRKTIQVGLAGSFTYDVKLSDGTVIDSGEVTIPAGSTQDFTVTAANFERELGTITKNNIPVDDLLTEDLLEKLDSRFNKLANYFEGNDAAMTALKAIYDPDNRDSASALLRITVADGKINKIAFNTDIVTVTSDKQIQIDSSLATWNAAYDELISRLHDLRLASGDEGVKVVERVLGATDVSAPIGTDDDKVDAAWKLPDKPDIETVFKTLRKDSETTELRFAANRTFSAEGQLGPIIEAIFGNLDVGGNITMTRTYQPED